MSNYISELNPKLASDVTGLFELVVQEPNGKANTTYRFNLEQLVSWIQTNTNYTEVYSLPIEEDGDDTVIVAGSAGSPHSEIIRVKSTGKVGVNTTTPTATFEVYSSNEAGGDIMITPESGDKMGFYVEPSDDGSPISLAKIHIGKRIQGIDASFVPLLSIDELGNTNLNVPNSDSTTTIGGYTQLGGSSAPAVKMIKLTGTTSAVSGGETQIAHGISDYDKIISCNVLVKNSINNWITPNTSNLDGCHYSVRIGPTYAIITLGDGVESPDVSADLITSADIVCTIFYTE